MQKAVARMTLAPVASRGVRIASAATANGNAAPLKILGICGSIRKESVNQKLLLLAQKTMPEGAELEIARIDDLPLINPDLEETVEGGATRFPPSVERLRQQVAAADAIFFATPEYNYSMPAPLKNAIDWVSRPLPKNEWAQKPTAIATIAGGFSGMLGRQAICVAADFVDLLILQKPAFFYNQWGPGGPPFNGAGEPTAEVSKRLGALMVALIDWTHRLEQK